MKIVRRCSRPGCPSPAIATLTYVYADSTAVLGPLATAAEPHSYDLCAVHAERLTVPRGWDAVRLADATAAPQPSSDDLEALADAVREAGRGVRGPVGTAGEPSATVPGVPGEAGQPLRAGARRGHLRVLSNEP